MNEKHKKTCKYLKYIEQVFILASTVIGCVIISAFTSLVSVPVGIASSAVDIEIFVITVETKKCKAIINRNKKKHGKIGLPGKPKLNTIKYLMFKALIDSYISHDEFVSVKYALTYDDTKEEIKDLKSSSINE